MIIPANEYCGDDGIKEFLKRAGSKLTIHELYGLFYGCLAATNLVKPSQYFPMIFSEEGVNFNSEEEANVVLSNLMSLWNDLARWKPETDPFIVPDTEYPDTDAGLKQRVNDNSSLIKYFIKGLDIGGTGEDDFSQDGIEALKFLSEADAFLVKYAELCDTNDAEENMVRDKTVDLLDQLEDVAGDCIARINIGLKEARIRATEELHMFADAQKKTLQARSTRIKRNDPCPCGSGKKYKKCCGLMH